MELRRLRASAAAGLIFCAILASGCATQSARRSGAAASHYSHMMHNRFYEAWVQPKVVGAPHGKISVPVDVRIDPRGRVVSFKIVRPSGDRAIDESIVAAGERVPQVAPPPGRADFQLRIFFELDVKG